MPGTHSVAHILPAEARCQAHIQSHTFSQPSFQRPPRSRCNEDKDTLLDGDGDDEENVDYDSFDDVDEL